MKKTIIVNLAGIQPGYGSIKAYMTYNVIGTSQDIDGVAIGSTVSFRTLQQTGALIVPDTFEAFIALLAETSH